MKINYVRSEPKPHEYERVFAHFITFQDPPSSPDPSAYDFDMWCHTLRSRD